MGHEVLAEWDSVWTPRSVPNAAENRGWSDEVWPATTRGAAIPRHLRADRLARSEAKAKRRKEDCEQWKRQLTTKEAECDDLGGKVISWRAEFESERRKCRRLCEERGRLDTAKRLAECGAKAEKNARENAELRVSELMRDVENLLRVEGGAAASRKSGEAPIYSRGTGPYEAGCRTKGGGC
jgi:hypothetical protein